MYVIQGGLLAKFECTALVDFGQEKIQLNASNKSIKLFFTSTKLSHKILILKTLEVGLSQSYGIQGVLNSTIHCWPSKLE